MKEETFTSTHPLQRLSQRVILGLEARLGVWGAGIVISLLFLALAALYVRPSTQPTALGIQYALLSEDPFSLEEPNPLGFRLLTPVISYALGLRGDLIIVTNLIFALGLLCCIYRYFRRRDPEDAVSSVAVFTLSLVTLTTVYYGGYTDSATYLLLFLTWWLRRSFIWVGVLYLLSLLNREAVIFLVPWLVFIQWPHTQTVSRRVYLVVISIGLPLLLYFAYREWIASMKPVDADLAFYLEPLLENPFYWIRQAFPYQGIGVFSVFKILWVIPVVAAVSLCRLGRSREVWSMGILLACTGAQLVIAWDSSRMMTLAFPVMVIALNHLFETNRWRFRTWVWWLLIANLLVPQLYTARSIIEVMRSLPVDMISRLMG